MSEIYKIEILRVKDRITSVLCRSANTRSNRFPSTIQLARKPKLHTSVSAS